ncbi:hypothetical protein NBM05_08615 [Rothia sp. AR01]|uniref:Uncharacterized protein n=1 Tax=Rothia santali TaxID=2949643 RepID=A0A9X2HJJ1_9MICC|nr:hypothetical protein [Rothia santali]MCP3426063.1 hypothetical protein [Rothia santali]
MLAPQQLDGAGLTEVRRPMTLRGLVAELRLAAQDSARPSARGRQRAAWPGWPRKGRTTPPARAPARARRRPADWWGLAP